MADNQPTGSVSILLQPTDTTAARAGLAVGRIAIASTSTIADADGLGPFSFQWQRSTDNLTWSNIGGATSSTYELQPADAYDFVRVQVSYTDGAGNFDSIASETRIRVTPTGTDGNDVIAGNLKIEPQTGPGQSTLYYIDGKGGFDVATYSSPAVQVSLESNHAIDVGFQIIGLGFGPINILTNVEEVRFTDRTQVFDLTSQQDSLTYSLYQSTFGRLPDTSGFRYWAGLADTGVLNQKGLAAAFLASAEFAATPGAAGHQAFVDQLYANAFGRVADAQGEAFWTDVVDRIGQTYVLTAFATSEEAARHIATHTMAGYWTV